MICEGGGSKDSLKKQGEDNRGRTVVESAVSPPQSKRD